MPVNAGCFHVLGELAGTGHVMRPGAYSIRIASDGVRTQCDVAGWSDGRGTNPDRRRDLGLASVAREKARWNRKVPVAQDSDVELSEFQPLRCSGQRRSSGITLRLQALNRSSAQVGTVFGHPYLLHGHGSNVIPETSRSTRTITRKVASSSLP